MSSNHSLMNAVYYPCWRIYKNLPPSALQLECINQVFYAFVRVNEDGTLKLLDEYADCIIPADGTKGCLSAAAKLKQHFPGLQILVSIGGGSGSAEFPVLAASPRTRLVFAESCRRFVDQYGFDGVDIDWEHPQTPEDGRNYISLLQAVRQSLPSPRFLITTALPVGEYVLKHIDLAAANRLLDSLNLMCYDFNGPWTSVSGHHAQLLPQPGRREDIFPDLRHSAHHSIGYIVSRGFPAHKIILGIPAYARSFAGARGIGHPFQGGEEIDYVDLPREWVHNAKVDHKLGAAYYLDSAPGGKGFVSFDVPATVRQKADYVKAMGLGGLFYWTGVGDIKGPESLVHAGWETLNRR